MSQYSYTKFPVAADRLTQEIEQAPIAVALDHITIFGNTLTIYFKANLSELEETELGNIVSEHTGEPLPQNAIAEVRTQFERTDLVLKIGRAEAAFDETGFAEIKIKVPGEVGSGDGRYISGGYAFTDSFTFGDKCTAIAVVDVDNVLGMGAETVVQTYHDDQLPASAQGWYMWPAPQVGGEVEVDPIGFYGFVPSGLYLELYFQLAPSGTATKVYTDFYWGRHYD